MTDVSTWSATDASNSATPPDGFPEGMYPSTVNNASRAIMGAVKRFYNDLGDKTYLLPYLPLTGGTLSGSVSGTALTLSGALTASGTVTGGNLATGGAVTATGAVTGGSLVTAGAANVLSVALSSVTALGRTGVHTILNNPSGAASLFLGGSDPTNYYDNTTHRFRTIGGAVNHTTLTASGMSVAGTGSFGGVLSAASLTVSGSASVAQFAVGGTATVGLSLTVSNSITAAGDVNVGGGAYVKGITSTYGTAGVFKSSNSIYFAGHIPNNAYIQYEDGGRDWIFSNINGPGLIWDAASGQLQDFQGPMAGNGAYINLSDRRLKTEIEPTGKGLPEILALQPVSFRRISKFKETPKELGFIAQDVRDSGLLEAIHELRDRSAEDAEPLLSLSSDTITACLVNAVKTMNETVETLRERIRVLEQER